MVKFMRLNNGIFHGIIWFYMVYLRLIYGFIWFYMVLYGFMRIIMEQPWDRKNGILMDLASSVISSVAGNGTSPK